MKTIMTWAELEEVSTRLAEFHTAAAECAEDLMNASAACSEVLLRKALAKWHDLHLRVLPPFKVSKAVYSSPGTEPKLQLVN